MTGGRVLIFANGALPDLHAAQQLIQPGDFVVCADGGARHARALGLAPDALIGDFDSLEETERARQLTGIIEVKSFSHDKDQTDLELALNYALERDPASIVVVGALGARLDHTLGNIALLLDARLVGRDCCLDDGVEKVVLCREGAEVSGAPGDLVSLVPWGGPAAGVTTQGLKWPLRGETLLAERSRGISNELLGDTARIHIDSGLVLLVHRRIRQAAASR